MVEENGRCHGIADVGVYRGDMCRGHLREDNTSLLTTVAIENLRMCMADIFLESLTQSAWRSEKLIPTVRSQSH
jgi:hypothetical protein